jgi:hypothetical protein
MNAGDNSSQKVMKHLRNFIASSYLKAVITIERGGQRAACEEAGEPASYDVLHISH